MKKRALTLLEMMIVIFLIGTILSVIAYNMKGSLDKGRAFKTEHAISQIQDILELEAANGNNPTSDDKAGVIAILKQSGMAKDPDKLMVDGWGTDFLVERDQEKDTIVISSEKYDAYKAKHDLQKEEED
jgi:prepilin-type N-terminal cleavage/methylation domain-containing protein